MKPLTIDQMPESLALLHDKADRIIEMLTMLTNGKPATSSRMSSLNGFEMGGGLLCLLTKIWKRSYLMASGTSRCRHLTGQAAIHPDRIVGYFQQTL